MKIYTRGGDDGTTALLYGGRVRKDDAAPAAYGDVDEAQAVLGLVRAEIDRDSELDILLVRLMRDLWVLMSELATAPANRRKLTPGSSLVTDAMVDELEPVIDDITGRFEQPTEFVLPGQTRVAALLDQARTVVRRAERSALAAAGDGSHVVPYLNRLSDLLWTLARWQEGDALPTRPQPTRSDT
jgi:cob(I)alamin adenosyltransferase